MSLENLSIALVYGAMAAYTVAMLGFAIDLFGLGSRTVAHKRRAAGIGMSTTWLAAVLHLGALITRTMAAGRVPWANMYEFTLMFTFFVVATFLGLNFARDMRFLGSLVNLLIVLGLGLATSVLYVNAEGAEYIRLSFSGPTEDRIKEGVRRLADTVQAERAATRAAG